MFEAADLNIQTDVLYTHIHSLTQNYLLYLRQITLITYTKKKKKENTNYEFASYSRCRFDLASRTGDVFQEVHIQ